MARALLYHATSDVSRQLETDLKKHGWTVDSCDGMLDMLRLIEKDGYDVIVLKANRFDVEMSVLLGAIDAIKKRPPVLLNLAEAVESRHSEFLALGFPMIRGELTATKMLEAMKEAV